MLLWDEIELFVVGFLSSPAVNLLWALPILLGGLLIVLYGGVAWMALKSAFFEEQPD